MQRNRVRNLAPKGAGEARGSSVAGYPVLVGDNVISNLGATTGKGIYCSLTTISRNNIGHHCSDHQYGGCINGGGNRELQRSRCRNLRRSGVVRIRGARAPYRSKAMNFIRACGAFAVLILFSAPVPDGRAAESYDNCKGFVDSLPATISTQGVWCLRKDLSTAMTSGNAIEIATHNVTLDCNGYKLGGLAAGEGTQTLGVYAGARLNTTVRNCNIRGFFIGVYLNGDGGHVVEDNRFDNNTYIGIFVNGDGSVVRRNQVLDTGGTTISTGEIIGIETWYDVDVLDNTVSAVTAPAPAGSGMPVGIRVHQSFGGINGNRVRGLLSDHGAKGIDTLSSGAPMVSGNQLRGDDSGDLFSIGVSCEGSTATRVRDNTIVDFLTGHDCGDGGGNDILP